MCAKSQYCAYGEELDGFLESPEDAPASVLMTLRAYIDESGHEAKGWMALAGFIGHRDQWRDFAPKWRIALGPQRPFLHMNSLRWNKDSTRVLLQKLGPIPESCGLERVMGGVRYQDYEDLVSGTDDERLMKGYIACLYPMVINILRGTPREERIELVFEEQRQYMFYADMVLRVIAMTSADGPDWKRTPDGRPRLAKWGWVPKGSTIMTDPADYLAFALRENWTDQNSKKAKWCLPILSEGKAEAYGRQMSRDRVRRVLKNAQLMFIYQEIHEIVTKLSRNAERNL